MQRFKNKYRIPSNRAPFWDYGWNAMYFITICTQNRAHWFGEITKGVMYLSEIGQIAQNEWLKTFEIRPDMNLWMGEYVVMPNHFHAIIRIGENQFNRKRGGQRGGDAMHCVSTTNANALTTTNANALATTNTNALTTTNANALATTNANTKTRAQKTKNLFGPQSKNLGSIIRGFKIGVKVSAQQIHSNFAWQSRYHDHIIRNERVFLRITQYIKNNPAHWKKDTFYR